MTQSATAAGATAVAATGELRLVEHLKRRVGRDRQVVLGIGDDAALVRTPPGQLLAVSTDTLVAGVHFPEQTAVADIGWKALAVNLSDMAAMGAVPRWVTLSLSLPGLELAWIDAFLDGFLALAAQHGVCLVGGDCTRAPLPVVSVTIGGMVPPEYPLRRSGARVRDQLWLSGCTGEAAAGLAILKSELTGCDPLASAVALGRLNRPLPRNALGVALRDKATAALDVSDGVLLDCQRLCSASGCAAEIELDRVPLSDALLDLAGHRARAQDWALTGGDDYELLFAAVPEAQSDLLALSARLKLPLTRIGRFVAGDGEVRVLKADGTQRHFERSGFDHFL